MPIRNFPMRRITNCEEYAPYLTCRFTNPDRPGLSVIEFALVDTGANACTVPAYLARELGHDVESGSTGITATASGTINLWQHTFTIEIFHSQQVENDRIDVDRKRVVLTLETILVDVLDSDVPVLLGVRDFLQNYTLTADYPRQMFSIQDLRGI